MDWKTATKLARRACLDTYADKEEATYVPESGDDYPIRGIFEAPGTNVEPEQNTSFATAKPAFGVELDDLEDDVGSGDKIIIRGTHYRIVDTEPDGEGGVLLLLNEI